MSEDPCSEPLDGTPAESFTSFCDERLRTLGKVERVELVGVSGKCLYRFDTSEPGMILSDGAGGFILTKSPSLDLPQLVNYLNGQGQLVFDAEGQQIEQEPPSADFIQVQMADGRWLKLRGEPGVASFLYWNGDEFVMRDFTEVPLETAYYEHATDLLLVGIDQLEDCEDENDPPVRQLKEWRPGIEGPVWFKADPVTGEIRPMVVDPCTAWEEDMTQSKTLPFIPACIGGKAVRFEGGATGSMLAWDHANKRWKLIEISATACDPECACAPYLTLTYECATGLFSITTPPTHVIMAKDADAAGVNARITVDIPWPALVTIYAARRLVPTVGSLDVVAADIVVDNCVVTSPDDGGMVAALQEASTNVGVAVLLLPAGQHTIYTSNQQTTSEDAIQWSGSWIKMTAHQIAECDPKNGLVVPGDIRSAYGGSGEECDCPPGPQGVAGPQGAQGPPGPAGGLDWDPPEGPPWPVYGHWCYTPEDGYQPTLMPTFEPTDAVSSDGNQYYSWCVDNLGNAQWVNISESVVVSTSP